jgi:hypothetical protein
VAISKQQIPLTRPQTDIQELFKIFVVTLGAGVTAQVFVQLIDRLFPNTT